MMHIFTRPQTLSILNPEIVVSMLLRQSYTYVVSDGNRFYIGSRLCKLNVLPHEDTAYLGSPLDEEFKIVPKTEKKKKIFSTFLTHYDAITHEIILHKKFDVANNNKFANLARQTSTGFSTSGPRSPKTRQKISETQKARYAKEGHNWLGKTHTPETRQKQSKALKARYAKERHHTLGKTLSPETRQRMSEAKKGEKNYRYDNTRRDWVHPVYGQKLKVTNQELKQAYPQDNIYTSNLSKVINKERKSCKGWSLLKSC